MIREVKCHLPAEGLAATSTTKPSVPKSTSQTVPVSTALAASTAKEPANQESGAKKKQPVAEVYDQPKKAQASSKNVSNNNSGSKKSANGKAGSAKGVKATEGKQKEAKQSSADHGWLVGTNIQVASKVLIFFV